MQNMTLNGITLERLADRRKLLGQIDSLRRDIDITGTMEGMDAFGQRALDVFTSSKLVDALDLSKEDPKMVARYGDGKPYQLPIRRGTHLQRSVVDGPPTDRSGHAGGQSELRSLGQPRPELRSWSATTVVSWINA